MAVKIRRDLPEIFDDFAEARQNSFLSVKEIKDAGNYLIGVFCTYFPREVATAADIYVTTLCQETDETIADAEQDLPRNLCPLIKSSYGFGKTNKCPFFYFSDLVVGETTCDGKKKMYEIMEDFKPTYIMELPNRRSENGFKMYRDEIIKLKEYIEDYFDVEITDEKVKKAILVENNVRRAMKDFYELMQEEVLPMDSFQLWDVLSSAQFALDRVGFVDQIKEAKEAVLAENKKISGKPRILVTGCPIGGSTEKVIKAVEDNGGIVVYYENCGGARLHEELVDEDNPDMYGALADFYLDIVCACMSPNQERMDRIAKTVEDYQVDGVLDMHLTACHPFQVEGEIVKRLCNEELGLPYLPIETDYGDGDIGQLNTRVAAFLEMI